MLFAFEFCADGEVFGLRDRQWWGQEPETWPPSSDLICSFGVSPIFPLQKNVAPPGREPPKAIARSALFPSAASSRASVYWRVYEYNSRCAVLYYTAVWATHVQTWTLQCRRGLGLFTSQVLFAGSLGQIGGTIWSWRLIQTELWLNSMLKCTV